MGQVPGVEGEVQAPQGEEAHKQEAPHLHLHMYTSGFKHTYSITFQEKDCEIFFDNLLFLNQAVGNYLYYVFHLVV